MAWEEERRSLEETISELNMRLAGKDHDITELRLQIDERERDLRFMHGKVDNGKSVGFFFSLTCSVHRVCMSVLYMPTHVCSLLILDSFGNHPKTPKCKKKKK